jgi:hypothetical protein
MYVPRALRVSQAAAVWGPRPSEPPPVAATAAAAGLKLGATARVRAEGSVEAQPQDRASHTLLAHAVSSAGTGAAAGAAPTAAESAPMRSARQSKVPAAAEISSRGAP